MKLILSEYIDALKEDGELDKLIQDILQAYGVTIFARPERGRQFGVDIYAVGKDFEDNGITKVFLITVKQGDLDRATWHGNQNALQPSLEDIRTVFLRNNLAAQHLTLPVKIVVAFNGLLKQNMEQNWRGYTERYLEHEYTLWNSGWLQDHFEAKLLSEDAFSSNTRSLLRKTIIYLENPDYQLNDFTELIACVADDFKKAKNKKTRLRILKELHVTVSIVVKYAEQADNLMHAVRITEKYILMLWGALQDITFDREYTLSFVKAYDILMKTFLSYYHKIGGVGMIRDGYSRQAQNSVIYTYTVYEQAGIIAMTGLIMLQTRDLLVQADESIQNAKETLTSKIDEIVSTLIYTINNNPIIYSPRADDHHIEICLIFIFLKKMGHDDQINNLLGMFNKQIAEGKLFLNLFPELTNSRTRIAELEVDYKERMSYDYKASNLLTVLVEWAAINEDYNSYSLYYQLKEKLLPELDLLLWFPEKETEQLLYTGAAMKDSGYALSNIKIPKSLEEMRELIKVEYEHNCFEKEFSFIKEGIWSIGLLASRHYRTYIFPHYWRQYL